MPQELKDAVENHDARYLLGRSEEIIEQHCKQLVGYKEPIKEEEEEDE